MLHVRFYKRGGVQNDFQHLAADCFYSNLSALFRVIGFLACSTSGFRIPIPPTTQALTRLLQVLGMQKYHEQASNKHAGDDPDAAPFCSFCGLHALGL
jgi:hypothetical protein